MWEGERGKGGRVELFEFVVLIDFEVIMFIFLWFGYELIYFFFIVYKSLG